MSTTKPEPPHGALGELRKKAATPTQQPRTEVLPPKAERSSKKPEAERSPKKE